jgi:hypothetical protein|tara:strand:+ start:495 stop:725 length:231 start_codon:yes stop_codon:yes gene_type:complete
MIIDGEEVMFVQSVDRGIDVLGQYWAVFYTWWYKGEVFKIGSDRIYESYTPEEENKDWVAEDTLRTIEVLLEQEIR